MENVLFQDEKSTDPISFPKTKPEIIRARSNQSPVELTRSLKAAARELGFELTGVCPAVTPVGFASFLEWLKAGYAGEMNYLETRKLAYEHPQHVLPEVKSLLMLGINYQTELPVIDDFQANGRIARYAWGVADYHDLIHQKLKQLKNVVAEIAPATNVRGVVDTAPLLEREFAQLAGIGWSAKNTMLINRQHGSWFLIAALLLDCELDYDSPFTADHCGTCTACLDACPTDAFPAAGTLDATKCISYLTIEHRSPIPIELRPKMDNWILGCDVCQEVCPWNRKTSISREPSFRPIAGNNPLELRDLFLLDDDSFRERFRKTPLWRPKRRGILRNAAIALGNQPADENVPALSRGLIDDESLIRGASAWALGRHRKELAMPLLLARLSVETSNQVGQEISDAIKFLK